MPHHFTKNTTEASIFCPTCMKMTPWKVTDGRRQFCLECYKKRQAQIRKQEPPAEDKQQNLF